MPALILKALPWIVTPVIYFFVRKDALAVGEKVGEGYEDLKKVFSSPLVIAGAVFVFVMFIYNLFFGGKR